MKLFLRYLKSKFPSILLFAAFTGMLLFSFSLYHLPAEAVLYPVILCLLLGLALLAVGFIRTRRRHKVLISLREMEEALPEVTDVEAEDYRELVRLLREEKLAVVLGTEGDGLSQETIARCDYTVKIPMSHGVDSLNVAAASAVAFWVLANEN